MPSLEDSARKLPHNPNLIKFKFSDNRKTYTLLYLGHPPEFLSVIFSAAFVLLPYYISTIKSGTKFNTKWNIVSLPF
jgi:hypothetical protein